MKILVTGASGNVGTEVVNQLVKKATVVAGCRNPEKAMKNRNATYLEFDYNKPETFQSVLEQVERVYLVVPPLDHEADERLKPFVDAIKKKGINKVVLLSAFGADQSPENPLRKVERLVIKQGFDYTIVRPNFFMENFTTGFLGESVMEGAISLSAGDGKISFISIKDVAKVITECLTGQGHSKQEYDITGIESLSHYDVVEEIGNATGFNVIYTDITPEQLKQYMLQEGMTEYQAEYMNNLYDACAKGLIEGVTNEVENVTGNQPKTFKEFVKANTDFWKRKHLELV